MLHQTSPKYTEAPLTEQGRLRQMLQIRRCRCTHSAHGEPAKLDRAGRKRLGWAF